MCEVFKPVIVFRTIFELVNNRKIQVEKHFVKEANYCLLNEEGRNIFITAFEGRLESVFDIVNIGLHFILKNVRPYAASCSEA